MLGSCSAHRNLSFIGGDVKGEANLLLFTRGEPNKLGQFGAKGAFTL